MRGAYNHRGSERFEHVEGKGWYVRTREGRKGPFSSRPEAEVWLAELIQDQSQPQPTGAARRNG